MNRRDILAGAVAVAASSAARPTVGQAQAAPTRRLGFLMVVDERPGSREWVQAALDGLSALGWREGQNLQVDLRWGYADAARIGKATEEILALKPDVVLAQGVVGARYFQRATKTVPVVFVQMQDPVGGGFVANLSRPDANLTGFTNFDYTMVGRWLQMLKEVQPGLGRALALINPDDRVRFDGYGDSLARHAPALGMRAELRGIRSAEDVIAAASAFAAEGADGGLVILPDASTIAHLDTILAQAARHRFPTVHPYADQVRRGGLMAYTSNAEEQYRAAASYIDRLLRGAAIGSLPVQASERFETVLNLKTAAALGLTIPPSLLARADEVIE
jgi:putative ABC transport system substrate-binding protein